MSRYASGRQPHILFVFLDGVGLGRPDPASNPMQRFSLPAFNRMAGEQPWTQSLQPVDAPDHVVRAIDATLGVEGLPQSGTGQASLFTGANCAQLAGRHYGPYPHSATRATIARHNIFRQILRTRRHHPEPAAFANAYPERFFQFAREKNRWTVTTLACVEADISIRTYADLLHGRALPADLTGAGWQRLTEHPIDPISESEAARRLLDISQQHPFTLFEYFLTDKAGHSRSFETGARILTSLDAFFGTLLDEIPPDTTLLVTSDHGNLEDLTTKSHTRNAVPLIARGRLARHFLQVRSLVDITPAVVEAFKSA